LCILCIHDDFIRRKSFTLCVFMDMLFACFISRYMCNIGILVVVTLLFVCGVHGRKSSGSAYHSRYGPWTDQ
jgi:cellobiose-specific phosphotransferase system component IIC